MKRINTENSIDIEEIVNAAIEEGDKNDRYKVFSLLMLSVFLEWELNSDNYGCVSEIMNEVKINDILAKVYPDPEALVDGIEELYMELASDFSVSINNLLENGET